MAVLAPDARDRFAADGVVHVPKLLACDELELLRDITDATIREPAPLFSHSGRPLPDSFLWLTQPALAELLARSRIAAAVAELLDLAAPRLFYDQIFVKDPERSHATPWHQDAPYWPIQGEALTVWLALDPVDRESGGVRYIAGSHRWGVVYRPTSRQQQDAWAQLDYPPMPDFDAQPPTELREWAVEPGDGLIHHALTIHASGPNTRPGRQRRAYATRWLGADARYQPRPETMDFPLELGLQPGDAMVGPLFPAIAAPR